MFSECLDIVFSQIKEQRQKMGTLKRSQQTEKKKNAQLLEEARKREEDRDDDSSQLKVNTGIY
jgi:ELKS/RAB6-interacting/CAST family protein 1